MPAFTLPLTVRDGSRAVRLRLRLARPLPWSAVRAEVCRAAGLGETAVLYHGAGAVEDSWLVGWPPLLASSVLATVPENEARGGDPLVVTVVAGPDAGRCLPVGGAVITIGRSDETDLRLTDPAVSWRHASIAPAAAGLAVSDLCSTNGVFVDGSRVDGPGTAVTGSVIRVGDSVLQVQLVAEPAGTFRADGRGHAIRTGRPATVAASPPAVPPRPAEPVPPSRRSLPVLSALVGAAVGGGLAIVLRNPLYLAFAAFGPATMIGSAISDRLRGRRSLRRQRRDFREATATWERAAHDAAVAFRRRAWLEWPGPAELVRRAEAESARLWTRPVGTGATVAVGCGSRVLSPGSPSGAGSSAGSGAAAGSSGQPQQPVWVSDVPVTATLSGVIGFAGATGRDVARYAVAQLACHYSPEDLALIVVTDRADFAPCQDLPHAARRIDPATPPSGTAESLGAGPAVVVLDGPAALRCPLGLSVLAAAGHAPRAADPGAAASGPAVWCLADVRKELPPQAVDVVSRASGTGSATGPIIPTGMNHLLLRRLCAALAPLRDAPRTTAAALPETVDLTGVTGPLLADSLKRRWREGATRAILGYGVGGAVEMDLDVDGPHVLIAGTTGSGKSELLQTFITSLAVNASPQAVTFLLVDYKGGAAFDALAELPHVVGVLTDLDPAGSSRSLASLRAELRRREHLEASGGPRPPKLVVVIDEFATLAVELPEFLAGMLDVAQRGRSLGLHLVVATQRPAGVVSPAMRANISARICLRVTDPAESIDVIGIPDAAMLPAAVPGRAIARLGGGTSVFQTARVSVPAPPEVWVGAESERDTPSGSFARRTPGVPLHEPPEQPATILGTVIDAARAAAVGMPPAGRPWLPPLPAHIDATDVSPGTLAVADLPQRQCRDELAAPEASTLVLGPPGSGCSTALRRIAVLAAGRRHELIVIDGSGGLADLRTWTAVSTYLTVREPRLVLRLLTLLGDPARNPRDGHQRHVVVDHLDLVVAELERTDYAIGGTLFTELLSRCAETVRISAGGPERLRHQRVAAGFRTLIELTGAAAPSAPGRGLWAGRTVQVVDAPVGCRPAPGAGSGAGPLRDATVVRPLPGVTYLSQLPAPRPSAVAFAVGGDAGLPVTVDLTGPGGGMIVAGPRRSGVTTALGVLARQAAVAGIPVLWASAARAATAPPVPAVTIVPCHAGPDALATALRGHRGPLLLVADHGGLGDDHPAAAAFERFLAVCGPGQHLLAGARVDALLRSRRGPLQAAASYRRGVLLSPDPSHGFLLDLSLPPRDGPVRAGRGVWVCDGTSTPVQVADIDERQDGGAIEHCEQAHRCDC